MVKPKVVSGGPKYLFQDGCASNTNHLLNTLNQDLNYKKPKCFWERSKRKNGKGKSRLQEVPRPPHYYHPWTELAFSLWAEGVILKRANKRDPHAPCHNLRSDQRLRPPLASIMVTREDPLRPSRLRTERPLPPEPTSAGGPSWEATMQSPRPRTRWQAPETPGAQRRSDLAAPSSLQARRPRGPGLAHALPSLPRRPGRTPAAGPETSPRSRASPPRRIGGQLVASRV